MGLIGATLGGLRATHARATIPAWGCWYASATIDGEHALSGRVTLQIADLTLSGTIVSGGPTLGRSVYRIVGGAGGWGRTLLVKQGQGGYANDAGVKLSTVLGDVASACGEAIVVTTDTRLGPSWAREEGPACETLNLLAPRAWYVDEAGVTRLGARAASALPAKVTRIAPVDLARGKVVLASESIAAILPGVVVDGLTAVDVMHEVSAEGGLRSTVWGEQAGSPIDNLRALVRQLDPDRAYRGVTEYTVGEVEGSRLNLQPVRASSGMPWLKRVPVRPGVAGCSAVVDVGTRVLVGFVDSDPARPYVSSFEDEDGDGFLPTSLSLAGGSVTDLTGGVGRVVRYGDPIVFSAPGPGFVSAGAVLTSFSKVSA